ncbi:MAG: molybdopterin-dependent oxidoreductase [Alphaproteobacteria bacterium]|nr:molybdopterin-dependent oxidoreductase [Alphaproteobacteria bacterium]
MFHDRPESPGERRPDAAPQSQSRRDPRRRDEGDGRARLMNAPGDAPAGRMLMTRERKPIVCRVCHAQCALLVDYEDGQPVAVHGDKDNPAFFGYSCIKGRQIAALPYLPSRLTHSLKRQSDGSYAPIASDSAAAEIADKIKALVDEYGPRSVALYIGTFGFNNFSAQGFALAFMQAIGSKMVFTSVTIDQPGKGIATGLHGPWMAGVPDVDEWDALLLVGTNPIVSMNGGLGFNPARRLHEAKKRGMKLVVIDPRETDCAKHADIHLQARPGEDPALLAGFARLWIEEGLIDRAFIAENADGFDALRAAVAPFTPEAVAARADVMAEDLVAAARMLGRAERGAISAGTGPNMSGRGNLVEYFVRSLTTLRGWWRKEGDIRRNPGVLIEPTPAIAASPGPVPAWGFGEKLRVRGLTECISGLPTAGLADEILTPGEGQIKALICLGGNPMLAWPDQLKTHEAMKALDLLVCFDPRHSATGRLAHYNIAVKLPLELEGNTALSEFIGTIGAGWGYPIPYAQATPPLAAPPPGSDVVEEWETFYAMAQRLGLKLRVKSFATFDPKRAAELSTDIDMDAKPSETDIWRVVLNGSPVPYDEVLKHPNGHVFERQGVPVAPKPPGWTGKLQIGAGVMMEELRQIAAAPPPAAGDYPLRVISRRLHDAHNSNWHEAPALRRRQPTNPAYMNPEDMAALGIAEGDVVDVESARSTIQCVAEAAPDVRRGCVSITHAWGANPDETIDPHTDGGNTGRLSFDDRDFDPYSGIPIMSAIPVRVRRAGALAAAE